MVKEMLDNYMGYKAGIKIKENKIKEIEQEEISVSSPNLEVNGDIKPKGYVKSNDEEKIVKNIDTVNKLKKEIEELQAKIDIVDSLVATLKHTEKNLIKMYYYEKKDPKIIANILGRETNSIHNSISNIIDKMEKIYQSV